LILKYKSDKLRKGGGIIVFFGTDEERENFFNSRL